MITKEEKEKRIKQLLKGKAICELENRSGPSDFLIEEQKKYINGVIDSNTLIENVFKHYKT